MGRGGGGRNTRGTRKLSGSVQCRRCINDAARAAAARRVPVWRTTARWYDGRSRGQISQGVATLLFAPISTSSFAGEHVVW